MEIHPLSEMFGPKMHSSGEEKVQLVEGSRNSNPRQVSIEELVKGRIKRADPVSTQELHEYDAACRVVPDDTEYRPREWLCRHYQPLRRHVLHSL